MGWDGIGGSVRLGISNKLMKIWMMMEYDDDDSDDDDGI